MLDHPEPLVLDVRDSALREWQNKRVLSSVARSTYARLVRHYVSCRQGCTAESIDPGGLCCPLAQEILESAAFEDAAKRLSVASPFRCYNCGDASLREGFCGGCGGAP